MTVFISHHSSKRATAAHLARYLERHGVSSWYAPRDIPPGSVWDQEISSAIRRSSALVLLFCSEADRSRHVKREINIADKHRVPIYWVRLESIEPEQLGYFLDQTQWIDWLDRRDTTLDSLLSTLSTVDSGEVSSATQALGAGEATSRAVAPQLPSWPRAVLALDDERAAGEAVARVYLTRALNADDCSFVLPTGRASTPVFRAINRLAAGHPPFGAVHLINDTETFGVWSGHETSRSRHVHEMLIEPLAERGLAPPSQQLHLLSGLITEEDPISSARKTLRRWPPAVHAVSVAPNGEVLGYEVGTYTDASAVADSGVGIIELTEHGRGYIDPDQPSRSVLSVGVGTALAASTLLVLGFPGNKANVIRHMILGPESPGVPATLLARHHNAFIITTASVAEEADLGELVESVTPEAAAQRICPT